MEANFSYSPVTDNTVADLIAIFGRSGVSVDREKIEAYSTDEVRSGSRLLCRDCGADITAYEIRKRISDSRDTARRGDRPLRRSGPRI